MINPIWKNLQEIYDKFKEELPKEALRMTKDEESDTELAFYGYQYVVNRLNEVVGIDHWNLENDVYIFSANKYIKDPLKKIQNK